MAEPQERADPFVKFINETLGPDKVDQDFAKDIQLPEVKAYIDANHLNLEAVRRWYEKPHDLYETRGDFDKFVEGCRDLVKKGDEIMMNVGSTGFNIDRFDIFTDEFTLENNKPTIFYNCYIERPMHFALLLADMERLGLLDDIKVDFSCKATKVNWKWGESDSEGEVKKMQRSDGMVVAVKSTMETVLKLSVNDWDKLPLILDYFDEHVFLKLDERGHLKKGCIPSSFQDPDIRVLPDFIEDDDLIAQPAVRAEVEERYKSATMNELSDKNGKLLVLRQESSFDNDPNKIGWVSRKVVINKELFDYLKSDDVKP